MNKKIIISLILLLILLASLFLYMKKENGPEYSYSPYQVRVGSLLQTVDASGMVTPQNRLEIKSPIPGRVEEILVKEGSSVRRGEVLGWTSSTERAALLDSVRSLGKAELKRWEDLYRPTPIIAPIDGTIILKGMERGQSFSATDALFTMADHLIVKANVDETDISQVGSKQKAIIVLDAYPQNRIEGEVVHLAYDSTTTNNVTSYAVDILPQEVPPYMRSGMTANVTVVVSSLENILLIPSAALISEKGESFVLVKVKDEYQRKKIAVGNSNGQEVEVKEGLSDGDVIFIRSIAFSGKEFSGSPFMPSRGKRK